MASFLALILGAVLYARPAAAATPCDAATYSNQCGWFASDALPPFVRDAIFSKGGALGAGNVLVLTSGDPGDPDAEISNDMSQNGCGTNPDGWDTYDCNLLDNFVPPEDSVVIALSSEWFEWYQTIYTDWMTISAGGVPTVDVSINSWINNKVDIIPYGPTDTGVVILTSLAKSKMVNFRVADSGDHIYDTAIVVVPATWFGAVSGSNQDNTLLCGDGKLEPGEECDDGNSVTDDGCSSICLGTQPPATPGPSATCGNLVYAWPTGATAPYTCGNDPCAGYRCVVGNTISPACYTSDQCAAACAGTCVDIKNAQLDCSVMCTVQPPASSTPPVVPPSCANLVYAWPDGTTMPYTCDDACTGQRCVTGTTISPACYTAGECPGSCTGECVDVATVDCAEVCNLADQVVAEQANPACDPAVDTAPRVAANQKGRCLGNMEVCSSNTSTWKVADGSWEPQDEMCNGLDDDCNGAADDMFVTCGDPGLCQNTVNTCDPANPSVPVACIPLTPPSPVEICNDGLDNDCDGAADDGCECGDEDCMPGETFATCPADCPPPANGTPCNDGNFCTLGDAYQSGTCVSGTTVNDCDDNNACTIGEFCSPASGCSATKVDCDDHDPCTTDGCDPVAGCTHTTIAACGSTDADGDGYPSIGAGGTDCDDGNPAVNPGAAEICNQVDDDCDAQIDEGFDAGAACQSEPNSCGATTDGVRVCAADGLTASCNAVTPANPPGYGSSCTSSPNACGATSSGTIECDGSCNAVTPANPPGYGSSCTSSPNACGATSPGTIQCDGSCNAVTPANPPGYGTSCTSSPNACGATSSGTIQCDGSCDAVTPPAADTDGDGTPDCLDTCPNGSGSPEVCNGIDDNCNGQIDEGVDADHDGVDDCHADRCLGTKADAQYDPPVPLFRLAPNRWELRTVAGKFVWATPQKKPSGFKPTIADTAGCSCRQILDARMASATRRGALGLLDDYLLGCTRDVLENWSGERS